eukprot:1306371-Prymnesium_polylepis.1
MPPPEPPPGQAPTSRGPPPILFFSWHASTVRSASWRYGRQWPQCSRSAWRRSRKHKSTRASMIPRPHDGLALRQFARA